MALVGLTHVLHIEPVYVILHFNSTNYSHEMHVIRLNFDHTDLSTLQHTCTISLRLLHYDKRLRYRGCTVPISYLYNSSASKQKGLSTRHLHTQLDPFALKLTTCSCYLLPVVMVVVCLSIGHTFTDITNTKYL